MYITYSIYSIQENPGLSQIRASGYKQYILDKFQSWARFIFFATPRHHQSGEYLVLPDNPMHSVHRAKCSIKLQVRIVEDYSIWQPFPDDAYTALFIINIRMKGYSIFCGIFNVYTLGWIDFRFFTNFNLRHASCGSQGS